MTILSKCAVSWIPPLGDAPPRSIDLPPSAIIAGWQRIRVRTTEPDAVIAVEIDFGGTDTPPLRMMLEPHSPSRFQKFFKTAVPVRRISLALDGAGRTGMTEITIERMGVLAILIFLAGKALRLLRRQRGKIDWRIALRHLRAASQPSASFGFRSSYAPPRDFEDYARWRSIHENADAIRAAASELDQRHAPGSLRVVILVGGALSRDAVEVAARASSIGRALTIDVVRSAEFGGGLSDGALVLPLARSGIFVPGAIEYLVASLTASEETAAVFADSDALGSDGARRAPRLKPHWDPELLLATDYIRAPLLLRWRSHMALVLASDAAIANPSYALALALTRAGSNPVRHLCDVLYHETDPELSAVDAETPTILSEHLTRAAVPAVIVTTKSKITKLSWPLPEPAPSLSVIIPSKDNPAMLKGCIDSIRSRTTGIKPEIIVADNGSTHPDTQTLLAQLESEGVVIYPCPGPFNYAKINNDARRLASGTVLIFLNDDTRVLSNDWAIELAGQALRPGIGAVGAKLLYGNGTIQHAGIILGVDGIAGHAFRHLSGDSAGYLDLLQCPRQVSAVTGACLAVTADHFDSVGGFDETLKVTLNDVDFCLRLRRSGLTNIWTPFAILEHLELVTRGVDATDDALRRQSAEVAIARKRWGELLDHDPYYHPKLSRRASDYSLGV